MKDEAPSLDEVQADPHKGDLLCFDGENWRVARRDGWHYPVPDPDVLKQMDFVKGTDGIYRDVPTS